jgi:hypothetical protein
MTDKVVVKLSKLDVARRQLETAIRLYFSMGDPVSIHTLTSAAYQVLRDLNKAHAWAPMLKDALPELVRQEDRDAVTKKLNEAVNFFKHADRDRAEVLEFKQEQTELFLFDACQKYRLLTSEAVPVLLLRALN